MDCYEKLAEKMESLAFHSPKTKHRVELEILRGLMTPKEAETACNLTSIPEPAATIAQRAGEDVEAIKSALEAMVAKRVIFKVYAEEPLYSMPPLHSIMAYQLGKLSPEDVELWDRYWREGMAEDLFTNKTPVFRVLPVNKSISTEMNVFSYEEAENLIDEAHVVTLADCSCRTNKRLVGKGCDAPVKDMCIVLDARGDFFAKNNIGRSATKEEAKKALAKGRAAGLVTNTVNVQKGPALICNCCGCCCGVLRAINELRIPSAVAKSNFIADVSSDECTGCGECVERCHVHALDLVGDSAKLKEDRCIGCGVCETICQFDAISLKRKDEIAQIPADGQEFMMLHIEGRPKG